MSAAVAVGIGAAAIGSVVLVGVAVAAVGLTPAGGPGATMAQLEAKRSHKVTNIKGKACRFGMTVWTQAQAMTLYQPLVCQLFEYRPT